MELQGIIIDGIAYKFSESCNCDDCALKDCSCGLDLYKEFIPSACDLSFGHSLIKDTSQDKGINIPAWKLKKIYEALRVTSNIHECHLERTAHDRMVVKAMLFIEKLLNKSV